MIQSLPPAVPSPDVLCPRLLMGLTTETTFGGMPFLDVIWQGPMRHPAVGEGCEMA